MGVVAAIIVGFGVATAGADAVDKDGPGIIHKYTFTPLCEDVLEGKFDKDHNCVDTNLDESADEAVADITE